MTLKSHKKSIFAVEMGQRQTILSSNDMQYNHQARLTIGTPYHAPKGQIWGVCCDVVVFVIHCCDEFADAFN